jgi:hypothetical protein
LVLPDGSFADVRIIKVRNTLLYVPTMWLDYYFVDRWPDKLIKSSSLETFNPDIHSVECPGIEHVMVLEGPTPYYGTNRGSATYFAFGDFAPVEIQGSGGRKQGFSLSVQPTVAPDGQEVTRPRISSVGDYWVTYGKDFFLIAPGPKVEDRRTKYEKELHKLAVWLATRPAKRDNTQVFFPTTMFRR